MVELYKKVDGKYIGEFEKSTRWVINTRGVKCFNIDTGKIIGIDTTKYDFEFFRSGLARSGATGFYFRGLKGRVCKVLRDNFVFTNTELLQFELQYIVGNYYELNKKGGDKNLILKLAVDINNSRSILFMDSESLAKSQYEKIKIYRDEKTFD